MIVCVFIDFPFHLNMEIKKMLLHFLIIKLTNVDRKKYDSGCINVKAQTILLK